MTEEEARKKDCPLTFSRPDDDGGPELCIGSSCMAWRWSDDFNVLVARFPAKTLDELKEIAQGYCGLAGKP